MLSDAQLIDKFLGTIRTQKSAYKQLFVIGFVGLPGSGKSTIARTLSEQLGLYVTSNDAIRRFLNEEGLDGESPNQALLQRIAEARTQYLYQQNVSHIIDADLLQFVKEAKGYARRYKARFYLVHVVCPKEVALERISSREIMLASGNIESYSRADRAAYDRRERVHAETSLPDDIFFTIHSELETEPQIQELIEKLRAQGVLKKTSEI